MANQPCGSKKNTRVGSYRWVTATLFVSWLLATAVLWVEFAVAPVGALAAAPVGRLVAIRGSTVTTTTGYFQVLAYPSALVGTRMRVIRTNSLASQTSLQLCAVRSAGEDYWCDDISDGYAGGLSATAFGRRAWSYGTMLGVLVLALVVTGFGWLPGVVAACVGAQRTETDDNLPSPS